MKVSIRSSSSSLTCCWRVYPLPPIWGLFFILLSPKSIKTDTRSWLSSPRLSPLSLSSEPAVGEGGSDDGVVVASLCHPHERRQVPPLCQGAAQELLCHRHVHSPAAAETVLRLQVEHKGAHTHTHTHTTISSSRVKLGRSSLVSGVCWSYKSSSNSSSTRGVLPYITTQTFGSCWHLHVGYVGLEENSRMNLEPEPGQTHWAASAIRGFLKVWRGKKKKHTALFNEIFFLLICKMGLASCFRQTRQTRANERENERTQPQDANTTSDIWLQSLKGIEPTVRLLYVSTTDSSG